MNMKTYLFAAALLQAATNAQQIPPPPHTDDEVFNDDEEAYENELSLDELIEASTAGDITQRGYFRSDAYQLDLTAEQKLAQLWELLVPDASNHSVPVKEHMWKEFDNFFVQKSNGPFCDSSDELRKGRPKTTHTQGLVAKIEWKPVKDASGATRFSGIYEEGTRTAIIRLSETKNLTSASEGLLPSFAIKFLIDNHKSENLFAMPNFTGKYKEYNEETEMMEENSSWDFFHGTFKNRVEPFEDQCHIDSMERKFLEGTDRPYVTSVVRPAFWRTKEVQADGSVVTVPHYKPTKGKEARDYSTYQFPFQLEYEGVHNFPNDRDAQWYDRLRDHFNDQCADTTGDGHCAAGVPLLDVYAWTAPDGKLDLNENPRGDRIKIATIELQTKLYTSEEGDNRLFFQHIRANKDYRVFPKAWKRNNEPDFPDFQRDRIPKDQWGKFPAIKDLNKKQEDREGGNWPWPSNDVDAEAQYIADISSGGCPFSWLF